MTTSKIVKIIINKFGEFNGEINLKDCTLINCVYLNSKEIIKLTNILKFMFTNEDCSDLEELQFADISDDAECPSVEVHIKTSTGEICILKKTYNNGVLDYEINGTEATQEDFQNKLQEHKCLFTFTCFLTPKAIESVMNLDNTSRINLIESICGNAELKIRYNQYKTKMEEMEISMKMLNEHKKEYFSEKKQEKLRIENSKKIKKATNEFDKTFEQFTLMNLYHNEKKINEIIPEELNLLNDTLDDVIAEYKTNYLRFQNSLETKIEIDYDVFESDKNLNKRLKSLIASKKNLIAYTNELESIDDRKKFSNLIRNACTRYQTQANESSKELEQLENTYTLYIDSIPEYTELKNKFFESNYEYMLYTFLKRQIDQLKMCQDKVEKNKLLVTCLMDENKMFKKQLEVLEKDEKKVIKNLYELSVKINKLISESVTIEIFIKEGKRKITDKLIHNNYNISDIKRMEQILRDKFSDSIIGILSDLFDVKESNGMTVTKSQILDCLGKYSNAIIVENASCLKEITRYLKVQQNDQISIILLPQKFYKPASPINLRNKSLPNIKMASIESFLDPVSDEIKTILMHFLKPTVVCDSNTFDNVHKIFNNLGKNVNILSFSAAVSYTTKKSIANHSTITDDKNIVDIAKNITDNVLKAADLNCDLEVDKYKYLMSLERLGIIKILVKFMKEVIARNTNHINTLNTKTEKLKEIVRMLNNDKHAKIVEIFEKLCNKFLPLLNDYYREFCEKYNLRKIEDYESVAPNLVYYTSSRKALQDGINILKNQVTILSKMVLEKDQEFFDTEKQQLEAIVDTAKLEVENLTDNFEDAKINCERHYTKWLEKIAEIVIEKEKTAEIEGNLKTMLLKIASRIIEKRMLKSDNYKLLEHAFFNFEKISLEDGNLLSQLDFNPYVNESFDLIQHHLEQIRPNYNSLDSKYKDINNFKKNCQDLQLIISTLKNDLNGFPLDFGGNDEELVSINEKLNNLSIEIKNTNIECQKVLGTLKTVTENRNKQFTECLKVINEEIKKFCKITTNERLYGELVPSNESEPFLGLQYCWHANSGIEFVDGSKRNWEAALAFWLGVIKYKKQNFVPYFEMSRELPIFNAIQKYSNSVETDLQTIVFWKAGIDENMCHLTIMRYRDNKMKIVDNEEEKRKLEIMLGD